MVRQSLFQSYGRFIAEFLDASYPEHLGLLDHPTGVGLRYGLMRLSVARVFLETEGDELIRRKADIRRSRLIHPADFPAGFSILRIARTVVAYASILLSRHPAPKVHKSFLEDIPTPS